MSTSDHEWLPPSGAAAWVTCAAWPTMNALYPETEETEASRDGTAAHWVGVELMNARPVAEGSTAPNGVIVTGEMLEAAGIYAANVLETLQSLDLDLMRAHVEEKIPIYTIHPKNGGTPDAWAYAPGQIHVWDFKFGHRYVEVFENWQLTDYAAGIMRLLQFDTHREQTTTVHFHIIQPRCYNQGGPVKSWSVLAADLRRAFNRLRDAAIAATAADPVATPNPECEFCPGRHACESLQRSAYDAAAHAYSSAPVELSNAAVGLELRMLQRAADRLKARITGLEETALAKVKAGERVPWFSMGFGSGRTVWDKPAAEVLALGQLFGVELAKPPEPITPNLAIKKGIPADVVKPYTVTPTGAAKLVPDDGTNARKVFGHD